MKQERCVLPVKCQRCNAVFDLWYDLQAQEQLRKEFPVEKSSAGFRARTLAMQSLCWNCRDEVGFEQAGYLNGEVGEYEIDLTFED